MDGEKRERERGEGERELVPFHRTDSNFGISALNGAEVSVHCLCYVLKVPFLPRSVSLLSSLSLSLSLSHCFTGERLGESYVRCGFARPMFNYHLSIQFSREGGGESKKFVRRFRSCGWAEISELYRDRPKLRLNTLQCVSLISPGSPGTHK